MHQLLRRRAVASESDVSDFVEMFFTAPLVLRHAAARPTKTQAIVVGQPVVVESGEAARECQLLLGIFSVVSSPPC